MNKCLILLALLLFTSCGEDIVNEVSLAEIPNFSEENYEIVSLDNSGNIEAIWFKNLEFLPGTVLDTLLEVKRIFLDHVDSVTNDLAKLTKLETIKIWAPDLTIAQPERNPIL